MTGESSPAPTPTPERTLEAQRACATTGVVITDDRGVISWANEGLGAMAGLAPEATLGRTMLDVLALAPTAPDTLALVGAIQSGRAFRGELPCGSRRGDVHRLRVELQPIGGDAGGCVAVLTDVTRERDRDTDIGQAERDLGAVRDALDEHLIFSVADRRGRIVDANREFCRISGYTREELVGQDHRIINSGVHPKAFWADVWKTIASGRAWRGEVCNRRKDGAFYWVDSTIIPHLDSRGNIDRYFSIRFDITEAKRSFAELDVMAERIALASESAELGVWDFEIETGTLSWDPMVYRIYRADPKTDTPSYEFWRSRIHPEDRERATREVDDAIAGRERFDTIFRIVTPAGETRWVTGTAELLHDSSGRPARMGGIYRDVTDEQRTLQELRDARALLEQTGRLGKIGGWALDLKTAKLSWTREVYRIHDVDPAIEPELESAIGFYAPEGRPLIEEAVRRGIESGEGWDLELPFVTAQGEGKWVRTIGIAEMDAGACVRLWGAFQDITEQHEVRRGLAELEERTRLFIEHTPAPVAMFDNEMRYMAASRGWYEQYGLDADSIIGRTHYEIFPTVPERWKTLHRRVLAGDRIRSDRDCFLREDGTMTWVRYQLSPWHTSAGEIGGMIMATEVIDRQIEHEQRLESANASLRATMEELERQSEVAREMAADAKAASVAKSEFLANMSHEIRTPMTAILGFADLLESEDEDVDAAEAVRTIRTNANHLLTIINDVLDMSKIESGRMTVEHVETRPAQVVAEVIDLMKSRASGKGIELDVRCEGAFPEVIYSDPTRLRQILLNLVGNAIKFTEVGSVTIAISHDPPSPSLRFAVEDTGVGMNTEELERISRFEPFTQADGSTTRRFGGTGLGLRISNVFAEMLGGGIDVRSVKGRGSTFTLSVAQGDTEGAAMIDEIATAGEDEQDDTSPASDADRLDGVRVLLAEDGPDNQRLISFHLRKAGAQVHVADNGRLAIEAIEERADAGEPFHAILMDMQMPELDGYQASRALRDRGCDLPIIALTAHAMEGDRDRCLAAGCDDYLTKPVDRGRLVQCLSAWIRTGRAEAA